MENNEQPSKQIERQTAKIASIKEIISGEYIKQEGWDPNYILSLKNEKLSRINLIGVVVTVPENSLSVFVDDGTGKIEARTFEENNMFKNITIGDIVLIIGRPREYNAEIYVNAETIKKITNKGWLEYRKKEIFLRNILKPDIKKTIEKTSKNSDDLKSDNNESFSDEHIDEIDILLLKIKDLDSGAGCSIQDLVEINPNYEDMVEQLLLKGEVFEVAPGKVKVLE